MQALSNRLEMSLVSDNKPGGNGDSSFSDDVWEQFARDTERDIRSSAPKEPSARARMVTERLRQQDERGDRPESWRVGPSLQEVNRRSGRRRRLWAAIGVPLAVVVAVVAMKPSLLPGDPFGTSSDDAPAASRLPDETAPPTAAPSASSGTPTLDRPFAGSPAERWADGADGIVVPRATAVGPLTEAQVATALRRTRTLLVEANLDPATLRGERPEAAIDTLDPKQPKMLDDVNAWLRSPGKDQDPLALFTRFDPKEIRLVGDVVKTRGRITFKAGERASVVIHADYSFVYPVTRADNNSTEVTRTIVRRVLDLEVSDPTKYRVTPGKLSVRRYDRDLANSACDVYDGFLHPRFDAADPGGPDPSGPTVDPYDRSRDIQHAEPGACGTVSRT